MWAANGSNEIMLQLLQAFGGPGRTAVSFAPTYSMYPEYARDTHTGWVVGRRAEDFTLDLPHALDVLAEHQPAVVLLASPNNPTGTALGLADIAALVDAAPGVVIVDEAYGEFRRAGVPSALTLLPSSPRLVVTRTMSKAFALAGGRLGYLAASPAVVEAVRIVRLPYHLSAVTQAVARVALAHAPELLAMVDELRAERDRTVEWLRGIGLQAAAVGRQLRAVRHLRRPARRLAAIAGAWCPDPRDRTGRVVARVDRHAGGDGGVPCRPGRGQRMSKLGKEPMSGASRGKRAKPAEDTSRTGRVERTTRETKVLVEIDLDGHGLTDVATGVGFYDHMLSSFGKHGLFDLTVAVEGDLHIDAHHTVEDTAIALGQAFAQAAGDKAGTRRFGDAMIPMDEALVQAAVDLSGRPYLVHNEPAGAPPTIGPDYASTLTRHVLESFTYHAAVALHVTVIGGRDWHHITEAQYKAVARALRAAVEPDPRVSGIPSTKGVL